MTTAQSLFHSEIVNTSLGWALTGSIVFVAFANVLAGDLIWAGLSLFIVLVIAAPALLTREWTVMVPWPLPFIAALAIAGHTINLYPEIAGYLAVSSFALISVSDLNAFTSVDLSPRFSVFFSVLTTMATQGLWTIAQYYSDIWLQTDYLASLFELQMDFVVVTIVAIAHGGFFELYITRFEHIGSHKRPPTMIQSP